MGPHALPDVAKPTIQGAKPAAPHHHAEDGVGTGHAEICVRRWAEEAGGGRGGGVLMTCMTVFV